VCCAFSCFYSALLLPFSESGDSLLTVLANFFSCLAAEGGSGAFFRADRKVMPQSSYDISCQSSSSPIHCPM
jgi:hypothetical protein